MTGIGLTLRMDLTDAQWAVLQPQLHPKPTRKRGRPWQDARAVLHRILWVLRSGAPWHDLPDRYPPYQTCHRRFQQWQRDGTLTRPLHALAEYLRDRGKLDLSEPSSTPASVRRKKGRCCRPDSPRKRQQNHGDRRTAMVFLSCRVASASPHETQLVESRSNTASPAPGRDE